MVGLVFAVGVWGAYILDTRIEREGYSSTAKITRKYIGADEDGTDYRVEYRFQVPGKEESILGSHSQRETQWRALKIGDPIEVYFQKENPLRNFPIGGGVTSLGLSIAITVVGVIFMLVGLVVFFGKPTS